jgi:uncharacterized YigZ family protein
LSTTKDTYLTIAAPTEGFFRDRGSKFLAFAFPVRDEHDIKQQLDALRKIHPKATHHCYAWRLGMGQDQYRANDDGEPSGTAGRPILGQIDSQGLTNVLIIIVRYYGGTNLGASGLINAYRVASQEALALANIEERIVEDIISFSFSFEKTGEVMRVVNKLNAQMLQQSYTPDPLYKVAIRQKDSAQLIALLEDIDTVQVVED